jgi:hypothetical protein
MVSERGGGECRALMEGGGISSQLWPMPGELVVGREGCEGSGRLHRANEAIIHWPSFGFTPLSGHGGRVATEEGGREEIRVLVQRRAG